MSKFCKHCGCEGVDQHFEDCPVVTKDPLAFEPVTAVDHTPLPDIDDVRAWKKLYAEDKKRKQELLQKTHKTNPRGSWSRKQERQYQAIKKQYLDEGTSDADAKRIAAATVNKLKKNPGITVALRPDEYEELQAAHSKAAELLLSYIVEEIPNYHGGESAVIEVPSELAPEIAKGLTGFRGTLRTKLKKAFGN